MLHFMLLKNEFVCNSVTLLFKDENLLQMSVFRLPKEYTMFQKLSIHGTWTKATFVLQIVR